MASAHQPLLSLSIVSHGDGVDLNHLLASIREYEEVGSLQLLITDNLRDDLASVDPRDWNSVTMIRPPRPQGFARNHNQAFEEATGMFFCVLNPDVLLQRPTFRPLLDHLEVGRADIVAPLIRDSRDDIQDSYRALPTPARLILRRMGRGPVPAPPANGGAIFPDWIAGTFMLMRRETFARLGGFDARYRLYFEDVDLCARARLMGLKILVDSAVEARHDPRWASRRAGRHLLWHLASAARFFLSDVYRRARAESRRA